MLYDMSGNASCVWLEWVGGKVVWVKHFYLCWGAIGNWEIVFIFMALSFLESPTVENPVPRVKLLFPFTFTKVIRVYSQSSLLWDG